MTSPSVSDEIAEQELLGFILRNPKDRLKAVVDILPIPEAFHDRKNQAIYGLMLEFYGKEDPFDISDLGLQLRDNTAFDNKPATVYMVELCEGVGCVMASPACHAERIQFLWFKRKVAAACELTIQCCQNGSQDSDEVTAQLREVLAIEVGGKEGIEAETDGMGDFVNDILDGTKINTSDCLKTPLPALNKLIIGIERGDMCIIAGPPSMGKTSLAIGITLENISRGKVMVYFAFDETKAALRRRILANKTGIPSYRLKQRNFSESERQLIYDAAAPIIAGGSTLFLHKAAGLTVSDIGSIARKIKLKYGLDGIIVDHIGQVRPGQQESRVMQVTDISAQLKILGLDLDVSVIAISQFNRGYDALGVNEFPRPTHLRDTGALEQDAVLVLFPWIPLERVRKRFGVDSKEYKAMKEKGGSDNPLAYVVVSKNKEGECREVKCRWNPPAMRFYEEIERNEEVERNEEIPF
jgi:replicative DNA helicase